MDLSKNCNNCKYSKTTANVDLLDVEFITICCNFQVKKAFKPLTFKDISKVFYIEKPEKFSCSYWKGISEDFIKK
jgi:hypothetical protein